MLTGPRQACARSLARVCLCVLVCIGEYANESVVRSGDALRRHIRGHNWIVVDVVIDGIGVVCANWICFRGLFSVPRGSTIIICIHILCSTKNKMGYLQRIAENCRMGFANLHLSWQKCDFVRFKTSSVSCFYIDNCMTKFSRPGDGCLLREICHRRLVYAMWSASETAMKNLAVIKI